mmetsp:Transcript_26337/g.67097  ORF Transcript_26337/g.67097 Transcript_26337/m.67097 type:complete len:1002 (-) Transcript_26337:5721-8726(-)
MDAIDLDQLKELMRQFKIAEEEGKDGFEMEEFVESFGTLLGSNNLSQLQLNHLFMKIDADANGSIDWDEFTNYMFIGRKGDTDLEEVGSDNHFENMKKEHDDKGACHNGMINRILHVKDIDKYLTGGTDGVVKVWKGTSLSYERTVPVCQAWITDLAFFPHSRKLVVASMDRRLTYYDLHRASFDLADVEKELAGSPLCLDKARIKEKDYLVVGDSKGEVRISPLRTDRKPLMSSTSKGPRMHIGNDDDPNTRIMKKKHSDWVTKVRFVNDLNSIISCSMDSTINIYDLAEEGRLIGTMSDHQKSVHDFDWSHKFNIIASCGLERTALIWNPGTRRSLAELRGHTSSIQAVKMMDSANQIISLGTDKTIKIWDVRTFRCLQTITDSSMYRPENRISSIATDHTRQRIIIGTNALNGYKRVKTDEELRFHEHSICAALFNPKFSQIVSGDDGSVVCVWSAETGELVFRFSDLHGSAKITDLHFDHIGRRMLTAASDGTVKMWNFNNGQLLKEFANESDAEISSVLYINEGGLQFIVGAGWNREVIVWEEEEESNEPIEPIVSFSGGHDHDIISMAFTPPAWLATGDYDGRIVLWNLASGTMRQQVYIPEHSEVTRFQRSILTLTFLPKKNGSLIATTNNGNLHVFTFTTKSAMEFEMSIDLNSLPRPRNERLVASSAMVNDDCSMLITGYTQGYVTVWDISGYEARTKQEPSTAFKPLFHWKAHSDSVNSVDFMDEQKMIITASSDRKIVLWTFEGRKVGTCGQRDLWDLSKPDTYAETSAEPKSIALQKLAQSKMDENERTTTQRRKSTATFFRDFDEAEEVEEEVVEEEPSIIDPNMEEDEEIPEEVGKEDEESSPAHPVVPPLFSSFIRPRSEPVLTPEEIRSAMELRLAATTAAQAAGVNALIDSGRHGLVDINSARDRIVGNGGAERMLQSAVAQRRDANNVVASTGGKRIAHGLHLHALESVPNSGMNVQSVTVVHAHAQSLMHSSSLPALTPAVQ